MCSFQERQRLETILSLCTELGRSDRDESSTATDPTSAVADLQKINQELEKLQVNDDDDDTPSVFSDSSAVNGLTGNGLITSPGLENGFYDDDLLVRRRRSSGQRDNRAESPAVSVRSFGPSPSPRTLRTNEVLKEHHRFILTYIDLHPLTLCLTRVKDCLSVTCDFGQLCKKLIRINMGSYYALCSLWKTWEWQGSLLVIQAKCQYKYPAHTQMGDIYSLLLD